MLALLILILCGCGLVASAQDGSDIIYRKVSELKTADVGSVVQIDFYNRNFALKRDRIGDSVKLRIAGREIQFKEHRNEDGFNNWFNEQYLESRDGKVRIREFKIESVEKDSIRVAAYLNVKPFEQELKIPNTEIGEILFRQ